MKASSASRSRTSARLLLVAALALAGCRASTRASGSSGTSAPTSGELPASFSTRGASSLGSGDLLEIRVFQEQELSGAFRLSPEGTIDYPLCGKVPLSGKTSSEAADAITECLKRTHVNPQVSVLVREYTSKKVFVFGEVQKPGTFPYDENMNIIQAVTLAGGFTKLAARNSISVTRIVNNQEKKIRVPVEDIGVGREKNFLLQPGDIVFVPESFF